MIGMYMASDLVPIVLGYYIFTGTYSGICAEGATDPTVSVYTMRTTMPITREIRVSFCTQMCLRVRVRYDCQDTLASQMVTLWQHDYQRCPIGRYGCVVLQGTLVAVLCLSTNKGNVEVWDWYANQLIFTALTHQTSGIATPDHVNLLYHDSHTRLCAWNSHTRTTRVFRFNIGRVVEISWGGVQTVIDSHPLGPRRIRYV